MSARLPSGHGLVGHVRGQSPSMSEAAAVREGHVPPSHGRGQAPDTSRKDTPRKDMH